jgi:hypothetical protein
MYRGKSANTFDRPRLSGVMVISAVQGQCQFAPRGDPGKRTITLEHLTGAKAAYWRFIVRVRAQR